MLETPALTRFESGKSIIRYLAPNGTEAKERFDVSFLKRLSLIFANTIPATAEVLIALPPLPHLL